MRAGGDDERVAVARAVVEGIEHHVDVNTLDHVDASQLGLNELGRVHLRRSSPLMLDPYARNRTAGSLIVSTNRRTTRPRTVWC